MYKADELEQQSTDIEDKCLRRTQSTVSATPGVPRQMMVQNREQVHQLRHSLQNKDTWNLVADSSGFETAFAHSD